MSRLYRINPCTQAELPDPVVHRADVNPLSLLPQKEKILVLEAIIPVDRHDLTDDRGPAFSKRKDPVSVRALFLGVVHQSGWSFLHALLCPLNVDRQFIPVNIRLPQGYKLADTKSEDKQKADRQCSRIVRDSPKLRVDFLLNRGDLMREVDP